MKLIMVAAIAAAAVGVAGTASAQEAAAKSAGCLNCHAVDTKKVGPAFKDVAAKYKGKDASAQLFDKVRKGGSGVYGPVPMAPNPVSKISDADLKKVVAYILKL